MNIMNNKTKTLLFSSFVAFFICLIYSGSASAVTVCKGASAGHFGDNGSGNAVTSYYTVDGSPAMCSEAEKASIDQTPCQGGFSYYQEWDPDVKKVLMVSPIGPLDGQYHLKYIAGYGGTYALFHSLLSYAKNGPWGSLGTGTVGWNSTDRLQNELNSINDWFDSHPDAEAELDNYDVYVTEARGMTQQFAWLDRNTPTWTYQEVDEPLESYPMTATISPQVYENNAWIDLAEGQTYYAKGQTTQFRFKYKVNGSYPKYCYYGDGENTSCVPTDTWADERTSRPFDITLEAGGKKEGNGHVSYYAKYACYRKVRYTYLDGVLYSTEDLGTWCQYEKKSKVDSHFYVFLPYNFQTIIDTSMGNNNTPTYAGENVKSTIKTSLTVYDPEYYGPTVPGKAHVKIIYFLVPPTTAYDENFTKGNELTKTGPCQYYENKGRGVYNCKETDKSNLSSFTGTFEASYRVPVNAAVGTKICAAAAIKPARGVPSTNTIYTDYWNISDASCRYIAKKPNLQMWGASFYTAGNATTSVTEYKYHNTDLKRKYVFGSWEEFAAIAKGEIKGFSTANLTGYINYPNSGGMQIQGDDRYCNRTLLSIANLSCSANVTGDSGVTLDNSIVDSVISRFSLIKGTPVSGNVNIGQSFETDGKTRYTYASGNITITNAYELGNGITHVIYAKKTTDSDGNITINTNFTYNNGPYTKADGIPQYLIIADGNINIAPNVSRIDAWLVAKNGQINTCNGYSIGATGTNGVSADNCNTKLTINGPVFTKKLITNRTIDGDPGAGTGFKPAEVFNLPSYTYYWAYSRAKAESQAYTTYIRELAPRY